MGFVLKKRRKLNDNPPLVASCKGVARRLSRAGRPVARPILTVIRLGMPQEKPSLTEEQIEALTIGELKPLSSPIEIVPYDPEWPDLFALEALKIRTALGDRVLRIEHVGSTSVPHLVAKPIIDTLLVVADSADEPAFVPSLEAAGYVLRIREANWYEHRMFNRPGAEINL